MFYAHLSTMRPEEKIDVWADFANDFPDWSTGVVTSCTVTLESIERDTGATEDTSESSSVIGTAVIESSEISGRNTRVLQRIETLVAGNYYLIKFSATVTGGGLMVAEHKFWCRAAT